MDAAVGVVSIVTATTGLHKMSTALLPAVGEHIVNPLSSISPLLAGATGLTIWLGVPVVGGVVLGNVASWGSALMRARKTNAANLDHVFS